MDNKNHVEFLTERVIGVDENGQERVIRLEPDDNKCVGKLCVVGPAMPEYDGGGLLLSYYKLIVNDDGTLALLEL